MRIAFFGGSFDPPHLGHTAVAIAAADRLSLDRVLFAPVGRQPLKRDSHAGSFSDRCRMIELAISSDPRLELSLADAPQPGDRPNYTIDTLGRLKAGLAPADRLFCLLGADSFLTLRQWHRSEELVLTCDFIVASRPGFALDRLSAGLPPGISTTLANPSVRLPVCGPGCDVVELYGDSGKRSTLYLLPDLDYEISATQIRSALADGTAAGHLLAPSVVDYIAFHHLYR